MNKFFHFLTAGLLGLLLSVPVFAGNTFYEKPLYVGGRFHIVFRDKNHKVLAVYDRHNLVTRTGAAQLVNNTFNASSFTSAWYMGEMITSNPTLSTQDTMASHAGWTEEASGSSTFTSPRPTFTTVAATNSGDVVTTNNSASQAVFTQQSTTTVYGFYIADSSTPGETASHLYCEVSIGPTGQPVVATNTVTVTYTVGTTAS